jgi:hypothetical protein
VDALTQARLKGAGMPWEPTHVNPMLALRTAGCLARWSEAWDQQNTHRLQHRNQRACERAVSRQEAAAARLVRAWWFWLSSCQKSALPSSPPPSPVRLSSPPAATLPGSCRPSASHPWKRSPACRPQLSAKIDAHPTCLGAVHFFAQLYNCERGRFDSSKSPCA